ncbi:uncharacterized protein LOC134527551 isoform X2 [Bacillus rossius redtenbacheri]
MRSSDLRALSVLPASAKQAPHDKPLLPPLTGSYPRWSRGGRLEVGLVSAPRPTPSATGTRVSKKVALVGRSEGLLPSMSADPLLRVTQLEQNIRLLQEQHHAMLASLHQEVEQLRQRNRDLQFQLVFAKGGITLSSSPSPTSSSEDDGKPKAVLSPKQPNVTPLQVEILERDIAELKSALQEANTRNLYLSGIVDEQKKKLDGLERRGPEARTDRRDAQNQVDEADPDLVLKLEEVQKVVRRLRRENDDQRRELGTLRSSLGIGGARGGHHRSQHQQSQSQSQLQSQRFPPLHSHGYWHHGQPQHHSQHRGGLEFVSHRHCANANNANANGAADKDAQLVCRPAPALPSLRRGGGYYGNHYYRATKEEGAENRKYRGGGGGGTNANTRKGARDAKQ